MTTPEELRYDYERQCWVGRDAAGTWRVLPCGHESGADQCHACSHAGEAVGECPDCGNKLPYRCPCGR